METGQGRRRLGGWLLLTALLLFPSACRAEFQSGLYDSLENKTVTRIDVAGNHITKPYVIRREIQTRVGEPLLVSTLAGDVSRLEDLGIFGEVIVVATEDSAGVALEFDVRETLWIIPAPAFSYSDANGWSYGGAISSVNLMGRDIQVTARALFGGTTTYGARIVYPWITGDHVGLDAFVAHLDREDFLDGFQEKSDQITPTISTWVGRHGRVRGLFTWFDIHSNVDGKTLSPTNTDHLHRLGGAVGFDGRDVVRYAHRGWYADFEAVKTGGPLGGNGNFWSTNLDLRRYQPFGDEQTVMVAGLLSLQTGTVGVTIPEYLQYRMGGENSIRGYDLDSLGAILYGQNQLIGTFEYHHSLIGRRGFRILRWTFPMGLDVAVFCDQGIAWIDPNDFSIRRFQVGGGVGLRVLVPGVDVIRLDFAVGQGGGIKIALASQPKVTAQKRRVR